MKKLSDEILNKFIDGELDRKSTDEVNEILKESPEDLQSLNEMLAIDRELKDIKEYKVGNNFTSVVMKRILTTAKFRKKDKRFIVVISSIFLALSLGVIGFAFYLIIPELSVSSSANQSVNSFLNYITKPALSLTKLVNSQGISILGSVFSLVLLISGYVFFETQKANKRRMSKYN